MDVGTEGFVWALSRLCRVHRIAFDPALVLRQFPPPYDLPALVRAAQACGLKAGLSHARFDKLPFPCIGFLRTGKPALLLRMEAGALLYVVEGDDEIRRDFAAQFEPNQVARGPLGSRGAVQLDLHRGVACRAVGRGSPAASSPILASAVFRPVLAAELSSPVPSPMPLPPLSARSAPAFFLFESTCR